MLAMAQIRQVAWLGDSYVKGPIRGVVLVFHGLGYTSMRRALEPEELVWARNGALVVFPYYGPWSWMNREARLLVDDLVDGVYAHLGLSTDIPLISTGGSMGGLSALIYSRYARRPLSACHALYPVTDLAFHYDERRDLPRTIRHALAGYDEPWDELIAEHSPIAQIAQMPRIPYLIVHGDADRMVDKTRHSDPYVEAMLAAGHDVDYVQVPGMGHGEPGPGSVYDARIDFVLNHLARADAKTNA